MTYCDFSPDSDEPGLPFTKERIDDLAGRLMERDLSALKNTERLAVLAGVFDRRPDAMMHQLKADTAGLGRSGSLDMTKHLVPTKSLTGISFPHVDMWRAALRSPSGIYVVVGSTRVARSVADPSVTYVMYHTQKRTLTANFTDFSRYAGTDKWEAHIESKLGITSRPPVFLCLYDARNVREMEIACRIARSVPTLVTTASDDSLADLFAKANDVRSSSPRMDVRILRVEGVGGGKEVTHELLSRFELFPV
jgi:hypothetical protein